MNLLDLIITPAFAEEAATGAGDPLGGLPFLIIMFVLMYFLLIRPQTKRQKEAEKMRTELKKGDHIVTTGGIHGTIEGIKDNDILLVKTATDTKLHVGRAAVTTVKTK